MDIIINSCHTIAHLKPKLLLYEIFLQYESQSLMKILEKNCFSSLNTPITTLTENKLLMTNKTNSFYFGNGTIKLM